MAVLSLEEIREYVSDYAPNNYLLDGEEFTNTYISLCISLAVDSFNSMTPLTRMDEFTFPSKVVLLHGTCWHMFQGKALLLARNTMQYSDGGLSIPVEERSELYSGLAGQFRSQFMEAAAKIKIQQNIECGWGSVITDESTFVSF